MANTEIENLLRKILGLKVTTIGQSTLKRAINKRMENLAITEEEAYVQKIKSSVMELNELIEEVVIPETWFFRDKEPFVVLTDFLKKKAATSSWSMMRLLSAPCSSGEEPYSLAIAMLKTGWPTNKFQVVGVDISTRSLTLARQGEYGENSFRDNEPGFRKDFFIKKGRTYVVHNYIRELVELKHGNLLNPAFISSLGKFDVIFCKNVLIYLDEESKARTIKSLERQLNDNGLLFVGHAETGLLANTKFTQLPAPKAFAFKKTPASDCPKTIPQKTSSLKRLTGLNRPGQKVRLNKPTADKTDDHLDMAQKLADKGRLQAAILSCETSMRENGPSAQAYFLLGVIHDANGSTTRAEKNFRKAVYLDPGHVDALLHLALLAERTGEKIKAQSLRARINRLRNNNV